MNVSYKREMRHNYLILEAAEGQEENFELRMLTENMIEGLLRLRVRQEEKGRFYYYEITSKQPLGRLLEFKEIKREELGKLMTGIGAVLYHLEDYLLQEANIVLEPEHIYIEPESYQVWLCYLPGYQKSFPEAMEKLLQYLLKKTDHKDNDTVVLAYRLYQESQKDYYGIGDLLRIVRESQQGKLKQLSVSTVYGQKEADQEEGRDRAEHEETLGNEHKPLHSWTQRKLPEQDSNYHGKRFRERNEPEQTIQGKTRLKQKLQTGKEILGLLMMLIAGPVIFWLLTGMEGFRRYGGIIAAAEIVAAFGGLFYLWKKRQAVFGNRKKLEESQRREWRMTFDEEFPEEEDVQEGDNTEKSISGDLCLGKQKQEEDKNAACINDGHGDTVLLAETSSESEGGHLLKSLTPAIPDIPVPYFPFIIGKQEGIVDHVLKKETVSRLHLRIDEEEGNCKVTDLNSSNGTIVEEHNLEANESYPLCSGDKLMIADVPFIFY